jgi:hypothetical protein
MAIKQSETSFGSLEELKSKLFPRLTYQETHSIEQLGFERVGANMADEAINALLVHNSSQQAL